MNIKGIIGIIFMILFGSTIIILIVLAIINQFQINNFKCVYNRFKIEYLDRYYHDKIEFQKHYYSKNHLIHKNIAYFIFKNKTKHITNNIIKMSNPQYSLLFLKNFLTLKKRHEIIDVFSIVRLTNQNIVFETKNCKQELVFEDILAINPTILNFKQGHKIGIIISLLKIKIILVTDNIVLSHLMFYLGKTENFRIPQ